MHAFLRHNHMMKRSLLMGFSLLLGQLALAQDLIVKNNEESLSARVLRIEEKVVICHLADAATETAIPKSEIQMVVYESGMRQYFSIVAVDGSRAAIPLATISSKDPMYQQGMRDARHQYDVVGPLTSTFYPAAIFPPAGIVVAVAVGVSQPHVNRSGLGNPDYLTNPNYMAGYNRKMRSRKTGAVVKGFLSGTLIFFAWVSLVSG